MSEKGKLTHEIADERKKKNKGSSINDVTVIRGRGSRVL
jgi:hypothetical protein